MPRSITYFLGCITGGAVGFWPLRMRPASAPTWRCMWRQYDTYSFWEEGQDRAQKSISLSDEQVRAVYHPTRILSIFFSAVERRLCCSSTEAARSSDAWNSASDQRFAKCSGLLLRRSPWIRCASARHLSSAASVPAFSMADSESVVMRRPH
jgi:hypothetical protein